MESSRRSQQALDSDSEGGKFDPETWREDIEAWWDVDGKAFVQKVVGGKVASQHVDDLCQDATFELMKTLERGSYEHRDDAQFRGFVRRIIATKVAQFYAQDARLDKRVMSVEDMPPHFDFVDPNADLDIRLEQQEQREIIRPLLDKLTPRRRQIIYFTYWEELGHAEIAERLNISEALVRQDKRRALQALREALNAAHPDLSI
ncbi:MAG: sigma-70 family RNA polymerase sigma factor [Anaerolineae bacterium]|nr:sigma-70 family RNA polymerase sigma factor [Anaerolineae bacterium]